MRMTFFRVLTADQDTVVTTPLKGGCSSNRRRGDTRQVREYNGERGRANIENELNRRIQLSFGKVRNIFSPKIPQCRKTKVFEQCVLPVMTYGSGTWSQSLSGVWKELCSEYLCMMKSEMSRSVAEPELST
ncbi:jg338 [Pararge aegeria aegeria]|uniref:Jg338 protein n=1 Tax=Pararge aegeria aegeria TaxID=348720 RepID=A0A8S4QTV2_9NEOP|nr:jg338 [Pararge aegeria aegeria]